MKLGDRQQNILNMVVSIYIKTGEPVGSKLVSQNLNVSVSSATVRAEMSELEKMGYLIQPHTSSGRIPTERGYRNYVNNLNILKEITEEEGRYIYCNILADASEENEILEKASDLLASMTNLVVLTANPSDCEAKVRHIQFIITGRRSSMIIMMTSSGLIKNKNFKVDYDVTPDILRMYHKIFNGKFSGMALTSITPALVNNFLKVARDIAHLLQVPCITFMAVCREALETDVNLKGQTNLLYLPGIDTVSYTHLTLPTKRIV
eukprot:TRINITY_DN1076_c0_g1_i19.p1 TRINITY_DN1076_c0_g1~~TRINITY_DN1076_c0_g1_i19.p1  ORF type:complete len:263 (+),score=-27.60 TRINITY_DN1076_c0_g1_i19:77-865(+)